MSGRCAEAVPAVEFRGAGFTYSASSDGAAVRDVNLTVPRGQCVVLTGVSGCGKTTLTRMVNGLIPAVYAGASLGDVLVEGRSMRDWEMDKLSCCVGSVFQNPRSQFFNLDTTSEIAFGCENMGLPRDEIRARVQGAAADLGIEQLLERDIRRLSGGERQMVALASAYALGPDIFVLDEPTASLDVEATRQLARVLARLKAAGKTIMVAEHRLWWLADVADRVVLMDKGRITRDWTAKEFGALPAHTRNNLGLRVWNVGEVKPTTCESTTGVIGSTGAESACAEVEKALEVSGLCAGYGRIPVLRGVDLAIEPGRIVGLVGRNGAGKTTLSRCIAGLHKEQAGTVALGGKVQRWRKRAGVAYLVMQETGYQLFADSVVHELEQAYRSGARLQEHAAPVSFTTEDSSCVVQALIERFGLAGLEERHPLSLSGGQRQRLAIAAGVAQGTRFMVLDEPTSGLDARNMQRVATELARLRAAGTSALVVTHDYEFLCAVCDDVVELDAGVVRAAYALTEATLPRVRAQFGFS